MSFLAPVDASIAPASVATNPTLGTEILPVRINTQSARFNMMAPITVPAAVDANNAVEVIVRCNIGTLTHNEWFRMNKNSITIEELSLSVVPCVNRHMAVVASFVPKAATTPTDFAAVVSSRSAMLDFTQLVPAGGASPKVKFEIRTILDPGIARTWTPYDPMNASPCLVFAIQYTHSAATTAGTMIGSYALTYTLSSA